MSNEQHNGLQEVDESGYDKMIRKSAEQGLAEFKVGDHAYGIHPGGGIFNGYITKIYRDKYDKLTFKIKKSKNRFETMNPSKDNIYQNIFKSKDEMITYLFRGCRAEEPTKEASDV